VKKRKRIDEFFFIFFVINLSFSIYVFIFCVLITCKYNIKENPVKMISK